MFLLVLRIFTDHHDGAFAFDNLAFFAHRFDRRPYLHQVPSSLVPVRDSASGEIIRGQFDGHPIAGQYPNVVHPNLARNVGQYFMTVFQLDAKHGIGQRFNDRAFYFNDILFSQKNPLLSLGIQRFPRLVYSHDMK